MQKITNVVALEMAIETLKAQGFDSEALAKLENVKASYEKKSHSPKKPTQTQLDNERLKAKIVDLLGSEPNRLFSVTEIAKALGDYSTQKISPLCKALLEANLVHKVEDKRKTYYKA